MATRIQSFRFTATLNWLWAVTVAVVAIAGLLYYYGVLPLAEKLILSATAATVVVLGLHWNAIRWLSASVFVLSATGVILYGNSLAAAEQVFLLKYVLSSQAAIAWMGTLYLLGFLAYVMHLGGAALAGRLGSRFCWAGVVLGLVGMLVRWRESWLMGAEIGHIPISNLYEVFVLFTIITTLLYLYYEQQYKTYATGAFVLFVVSLATGFLFWYGWDRGADQIQPLVPALQSYWMKIHVPANFVGYGCFSIAAMLGSACLLSTWLQQYYPDTIWRTRLPELSLLHDLMYRSTVLGFVFFSLATILGSLWAAEAWGGYWSWDPKETWALIVWLNYAAWLHAHIARGWRGNLMAWWSLAGLFVTLFAFLGVNMFLSGLHSYGSL